MRRLVHFTILLLFVSTGAIAQNKYWVAPGASGNWSNAANWSLTSGGAGGAGAPTAAQSAIFNGGSIANCLLDPATITLGSITINGPYTGSIIPAGTTTMTLSGSFIVGGGSFTGPDNLTVTSSFTLGNGVFTTGANTTFNEVAAFNSGTANFNGTVTFNRNANFAFPANTLNPNTSTVVISGITNSAINVNANNPGSITFYNLTINKTNTSADNFNVGVGDVFTVLNDFSLQNGFYRGQGTTLQVGAGFTVGQTSKGGNANLVFNGTQNGTVRVNAPWSTPTTGSGTTTINKSAPTATLSFVTDLPSNTIDFNQVTNSDFVITSGTLNFPDGDDVIFNANNFTIGTAGTVSGTNGNMTIRSNFNNSGNFIANNGTVTFESTVKTYSVGTIAQNGTTNFYNVVLNMAPSGILNIQLGDRLTASNNLTLQSGIFSVPGGDINNQGFVQVGGNLNVTSGSANMPPAVHLEFGGPNAQTVSFASGTNSFFNGNISFVKTAPGPITLNSQIVLDAASQLITFTGGVINSTSVNTLNFAGNGAIAVGGNSSSYIDGPVLRSGTSAFTFPTGDGGIYAPIHISGAGFNSVLPNATYLAQYVRSNPDGTYPTDQLSPTNPPELKISELEYWILDQQGPATTGPRVWLSYEGSRSGVTDPTTIGVTAWDFPGFWQLIGNGGLQNVAGVSYVSSASTNVSNVSSADPVFTLSTIDEIANPLPVTWLSFTGRYFNGSVDLNWSTSLEVNNEEYTIERSADGQSFTTIGNVAGVGNTSSVSRYTFKDTNPLSGSAYYRIKQTDRDGKFSYSEVIRVANGEVALKGLRLFPNPSSGKMPLTIENGNWSNKKVTITIYNAVGGIVRQEQITFGSDSRAKINVEALQKGSYFITTSINNERQTMQFFIQ
jgi:hypothetical protein